MAEEATKPNPPDKPAAGTDAAPKPEPTEVAGAGKNNPGPHQEFGGERS